MEESNTSKTFTPEVRDRAVRLARAQREQPTSEWATLCLIDEKVGCSVETLRK